MAKTYTTYARLLAVAMVVSIAAWALPAYAATDAETLTPPQAPNIISSYAAGASTKLEKIKGTKKDDVLLGNAGDNLIYGYKGDDLIKGRKGNDVLFGNKGFDTLRGQAGDDILRGNQKRDRLFGGPGNDLLEGGYGRDFIFGGKGNDRLVGGPGEDRMRGGPGKDEFVVSVDEGTHNRINDFEKGDKLVFKYNGDGTVVRYGNSPFGLLLYYGDAFFYIKDVTMTDLADLGDWYAWEFAG